MTVRVVTVIVGLATVAVLAATAPVAVSSAAPAGGVEILRARTRASIQTAASGAEMIELRFVAELVNESRRVISDDVVVTWPEVGGFEPTPFRVLIPAGCFMDRRGRGFFVDDFRACGVQLSVASSARGRALLEIVDFQAKLVRRDDGVSRFDIAASFVPPDPVIPPDPIVPATAARAFLGIVGGAAVEIAIGSSFSPSPPLRLETVSGVEPEPF